MKGIKISMTASDGTTRMELATLVATLSKTRFLKQSVPIATPIKKHKKSATSVSVTCCPTSAKYFSLLFKIYPNIPRRYVSAAWRRHPLIISLHPVKMTFSALRET
jgi:hypothetical protein